MSLSRQSLALVLTTQNKQQKIHQKYKLGKKHTQKLIQMTKLSAGHLQYHKPTKSMHSSASHLLSIPWQNLSFGSLAFHISAPKLWNSLPPQILKSQALSSARCHLKTHYFQSASAAISYVLTKVLT